MANMSPAACAWRWQTCLLQHVRGGGGGADRVQAMKQAKKYGGWFRPVGSIHITLGVFAMPCTPDMEAEMVQALERGKFASVLYQNRIPRVTFSDLTSFPVQERGIQAAGERTNAVFTMPLAPEGRTDQSKAASCNKAFGSLLDAVTQHLEELKMPEAVSLDMNRHKGPFTSHISLLRGRDLSLSDVPKELRRFSGGEMAPLSLSLCRMGPKGPRGHEHYEELWRSGPLYNEASSNCCG
ncbi:hypothetical protein KIPB_006639, partial [Kipferlia bialata]|eukprot:g6639.t1